MHNSFQIDTLPRTPWKNGKGLTRELAMGPQGADIAVFDWRVTLADIEPGAFSFSHFAGIDRTTVVTGAGMCVRRRAQPLSPMHSIDPYSPLSISGDEPIDAEHDGVPIHAFNLMSRRGKVRGSLSVHRQVGRVALVADITILLCVRGDAMVELDGQPPLLLGPGQAIDVRLKAPGAYAFDCRSAETILLAAMILLEKETV